MNPFLSSYAFFLNCIYIAIIGLLIIGGVFGGREALKYARKNDIRMSDVQNIFVAIRDGEAQGD